MNEALPLTITLTMPITREQIDMTITMLVQLRDGIDVSNEHTQKERCRIWAESLGEK